VLPLRVAVKPCLIKFETRKFQKMHVHELNPRRTIIAMIVFVIIIVAGLLTLTNPRLKYALTPEETVSLTVMDDGGITPEKLDNLLTGSTEQIEVIDIRNHYEFARGHIPGARNFSAVELLEKDNFKWLKDLQENGFHVVIYGQNQMQANGPWMVFRQIGLNNVDVLLGGYDYYLSFKNKEIQDYSPCKADFNYAEVAKVKASAGENNPQPAKKKAVVRRKKKGAAVAGGC
jgi:3-mercaptopyruvate sulfurtransferase SseA